jgi:hypothetical protein
VLGSLTFEKLCSTICPSVILCKRSLSRVNMLFVRGEGASLLLSWKVMKFGDTGLYPGIGLQGRLSFIISLDNDFVITSLAKVLCSFLGETQVVLTTEDWGSVFGVKTLLLVVFIDADRLRLVILVKVEAGCDSGSFREAVLEIKLFDLSSSWSGMEVLMESEDIE